MNKFYESTKAVVINYFKARLKTIQISLNVKSVNSNFTVIDSNIKKILSTFGLEN